METVLINAILAITILFLGLAGLIIIGKVWREGLESYQRAHRAQLEPQVLAYAHGHQPSLAEVLGDELRRRDRGVLERILLDHAQRTRGVAHERLSQALEELGFVDEMLAGLRSRRWWFRASAAEKLGLAGAGRAADPLAAALHDESSEVRMRAAKGLGALGGRRSARVLIRALNEPNRWSTIRIADILTGMGREVVGELIDAFPGLDLSGKLAALDILSRIRPLQSAEWLVQRFTDAEPDVRARSAHALGCIGAPNSVGPLIEALGDPAWPVRAMAAKALGRIRRTEAIPELANRLRDPEWWVRSNAAHALVATGTQGLRALVGMLGDDDRYAEHQAVLMLEQAGVVDQQALSLARPPGPERSTAIAFIRRLVSVGQIDRLEALATEHPNPKVREGLRELLPLEPDAAGAG